MGGDVNLGLDQIVVGERYRLVIRPNPEYACEGCGIVRGIRPDMQHFNGRVVTVEQDSSGTFAKCLDCGHVRLLPEGMYQIGRIRTGWFVVPFTWLQPLDAPYEPKAPAAYVMGVDTGIGTSIEVTTP